MNYAVPGYDVTMHFWVEETDTGRTLVPPFMATYTVQPPAWCHDDSVALEMHLDHLAKLKCLCEMRRDTENYAVLQSRSDYIVRAFMQQYCFPADHQGQKKVVEFSHMHLRVA